MQMGDSYIKVWVCVMARLDEETSYGQISKGANVSKSQTYRAVQWGVNQLIDMGVSVSVQSTDNFIVISIGKSVVTAIQKVEKPAEEKATPALAADVKIGVLLGFTGPIESLTPDMASGAEIAMKEASELFKSVK